MKKLFPILTFLIISFSAIAQDYPSFSPGVTISPNIAWASTSVNTVPSNLSASSSNAKFGYCIGVTLDYMKKETYGLCAEFRIQRLDMGYNLNSISPTGVSITNASNVFYQYIEIPVGIKMRTVEFGYSRFYAKAGLNPAICTKAEATITSNNGINNSTTAVSNISSRTTPINLGLFIGMGLEYTIAGTTALVGGLTYHYGVIDIYKDPNSTDNFTINTRYLSMDLAIKF